MAFHTNFSVAAAARASGTGIAASRMTAEYGDELLTLSTCDYYTDYGRFVVVARRVKSAYPRITATGSPLS